MLFLRKYVLRLLVELGIYPKDAASSSFGQRRKLAILKKRVSNGIRLSVFCIVIIAVGLMINLPEPASDSTPLILSRLHDNWKAEPGRMTKDCKTMPHLSELEINIRPLAQNKVIIYASPSSEVMPSSLVLQLQHAETLTEGRVFRAVRQSDSVGFNMILSEESNKLTLAFALEDGPTTGEYVLSFFRYEDKNNELFSY